MPACVCLYKFIEKFSAFSFLDGHNTSGLLINILLIHNNSILFQ